jgi:D-amino-acid dehydrogenase
MSESRPGRRAAIVGAGIVGLCVAWFLQDEGFAVTVYDRRDVAAGASAGNAGWISPAMVAPLPEPSALRYGLTSLLRPASPLRIPPSALPGTWRFLLAFAAHCTQRQWQSGIAGFAGLNALALSSYQALAEAGVTGRTEEAPVVAAFDEPGQAGPLRHELQAVATHGGVDFTVDELGPADLHTEQPLLGPRATYGLRIGGQRFLQPLDFVRSLAASVRSRGGQIAAGVPVTAIAGRDGGAGGVGGVRLQAGGQGADFDVCVLANGAWISELARPAGVRVRVQAGRGYSFTVAAPEPLVQPLYLPAARVACTPAPGGFRVAGTMEFRPADDPLDRRRIAAIVASARDYVPSADWAGLTGSWVGPRPVTADGLPVIGATRTGGLFVAGGHGMWGMTLGPATGRVLARQIASGQPEAALAPFDPLR